MLTFLVPLTIPYLDRIIALNLGFPLIILAITCLVTIYLAVDVLRPGKFVGQGIKPEGSNYNFSPFFFGNFHNMEKSEFLAYTGEVLNDEYLVKSFISNDFYHIGLRLAQKMRMTIADFRKLTLGVKLSENGQPDWDKFLTVVSQGLPFSRRDWDNIYSVPNLFDSDGLTRAKPTDPCAIRRRCSIS